jgi:4-amino-4-deoxy-L-arabinose transferase-like glycosyltransferase
MSKVLLIIIFIAAFAVRFYNLGVIPDGLSQDETSLGYNTYSILQTGKDEYGKSFPTSFKAFGEYKLPGYIYLSAPSIAVLGTTPLGVRLPSAIFGFLTVIVFYLLVRKLTKDQTVSIVATALLALNPWHVNFSRAAFEVVPALFFIVFGSYLFLQFVGTKRYIFFLLSTCFFILSMYIYNICKVFSPLLFLLLLFMYKKEIPFRKNMFWLSIIPAIILLLPFLIDVISSGGYTSTKGTLLHSSAVIQAQLLELRSSVVMQNSLFATLFFNKWLLTGYTYLQHIVSYFSPSFLFITGSEHGNHGIGNVGMFYLFEFVTVIVGIIAYIKKPQRWLTLLLIWGALCVLIAAYTREAPHGTRGFFLIPTVIAFSAFGLLELFSKLQKVSKPIRQVIVIIAVLFAGYSVLYYFSSYYFRFPILYGVSWRSEDRELLSYIKANQNEYDRVIFDKTSGFIYTSLLYYLRFDPEVFQRTVQRGPDDSEGFSTVHSFGKYSFEDVNWETVKKQQRTLIVTKSERLPSDIGISLTMYYPEKPIVAAVGQEILQFPAKDEAYVVVEIK